MSQPEVDQQQSMLSLRDVHKVYKIKPKGIASMRTPAREVRALNGLNLEVAAGTIHGIVGTSGAGKSTLVRCLTALETPTSGVITVDGQNLSDLNQRDLREARRKIGMVFQHANLMDALTTVQNVAYPLALARAPHGYRRERVSKMLDLVGLTDRADSYPSQLSGGQKQRVGIARALADEPSVLLCDEPTSALDPETTRSILDLIRSARDTLGVTVVIITHEMSVVRSICDSVSLLEAGQIVEGGPIDEVVSQVDSRLSRELVPLPEVSEKVLGRGDVVVDLAITAKKGQPAAAKILNIAADRGGDVAGGVFQTIAGAQIGRLAITVEPSRAQGLIDALADAGAKPSLRDTSKEVAA